MSHIDNARREFFRVLGHTFSTLPQAGRFAKQCAGESGMTVEVYSSKFSAHPQRIIKPEKIK